MAVGEGARTRQNRADGVGLCLGLAALVMLWQPAGERLHGRGPMNRGTTI